jgi:hypothetical protein
MSNVSRMHLTHPITGHELLPVGFRSARPGEIGDQPIWPIMGGSGEGGDGGGQGGDGSGGTPAAGGDSFTAITTQADLDKVVGDRVARERGKYADYDDLKNKAAEFDKLADANKSEVEKANDKAAKAQAEVDKLPAKVAEALKPHLTAMHKISDEDAELFLTATDPELLLKQVNGLVGRTQQSKNKHRVATEGTHVSAPTEDEERAAARKLFNPGAS